MLLFGRGLAVATTTAGCSTTTTKEFQESLFLVLFGTSSAVFDDLLLLLLLLSSIKGPGRLSGKICACLSTCTAESKEARRPILGRGGCQRSAGRRW